MKKITKIFAVISLRGRGGRRSSSLSLMSIIGDCILQVRKRLKCSHVNPIKLISNKTNLDPIPYFMNWPPIPDPAIRDREAFNKVNNKNVLFVFLFSLNGWGIDVQSTIHNKQTLPSALEKFKLLSVCFKQGGWKMYCFYLQDLLWRYFFQ